MQIEEDIVFRLKKRAEIRRQISTRKSVQEGKPDRISDLLEEAAEEIQKLRESKPTLEQISNDQILSREFLFKAGIICEDGSLSKNYE